MTTRVLYLSYDGMTDPLGQSQVLSYLVPLSKGEASFDLVSFEKPDRFANGKAHVLDLIEGHDIRWHPLRYHRRAAIVSTLIDLRNGWTRVRELQAERRFDIVHARSYIPAVIASKMKRRYGTKFLFDMRGWWADEKKESGQWRGPLYEPVYRYFKKLERRFFAEADGSISLTFAGRREIERLGYQPSGQVEVIPTCVNLDVFKPFSDHLRTSMRAELAIDRGDYVLIYSGALGGYYRTDVVLAIFKKMLELRPSSTLVLLTATDHPTIHREIARSGAPRERIRVASSDFVDVHKYLMAADLGLVIYDGTFSSLGRSPTKMAEYWACGLPVLTMKNVGDLDRIIEQYPGSGVQLSEFADAEYERCLTEALTLSVSKQTLRDYAKDYFDLNKGVEQYRLIYRRLS